MDFATFATIVKKYAKNPKMANDDLVNQLLSPIIYTYDIHNKKGESLLLSKARVSEIMNHKADIPNAIKKELGRSTIIYDIIDEMGIFIEECIDWQRTNKLIGELISVLRTEENFDNVLIEDLDNESKDLNKFLSHILVISLSESNKNKDYGTILRIEDNKKIKTVIGDLFSYGFNNRKTEKNIIVIPVNTAFDTHITRKLEGESFPLVSEKTIHGQWLNRMKKAGNDIELLNKRISTSLATLGFVPTGKALVGNGRTDTYPIGAISVIEYGNSIYFLLAISEFDGNNNARSSEKQIELALNSLVEVYDRIGMGYNMYMPVIGTGLSRSGMTFYDSYSLIKNTLLSNSSNIHGTIHIVVHFNDKDKIVMKG